nr:immunoglobulin heavy chain junction region [Mus musculus]MBK4197875.1 immunoglobulin heavy chain junction region [Mus musculus]MBK4197876.1 immunoglobulin heavy chain junction region [Mus musculus]MBK4197877.1 immunoglobulin heavy chain junction region [Mus musculus]
CARGSFGYPYYFDYW